MTVKINPWLTVKIYPTLPGGIPHFPGQQHLLVNERYWWQIK